MKKRPLPHTIIKDIFIPEIDNLDYFFEYQSLIHRIDFKLIALINTANRVYYFWGMCF